MHIKPFLALWVAALLLTLGGCGKKGDLVLPTPAPASTTTPSHAP